jgi:hypothetical protein
MIPDSVLTRINPARELQTISLGPSEFAAMAKDDAAVCQNHRITVVEKEEKHQSRSLPSFTGTFASVRE